jgi:valyl-tRNA synthetase
VTEAIDRGMLARMETLVDRATRQFEAYDYAAALRDIEETFWWFCDDYIELVKRRRAGEDAAAASAVSASTAALSVLLRLFAPVLPFVTEEVWSWWKEGSVHRARWPETGELRALAGPPADADLAAVALASAITAGLRQERSSRKLGFGVPVRARLGLTPAHAPQWPAIQRDVLAGNNVVAADVTFAGESVEVAIEPEPANA